MPRRKGTELGDKLKELGTFGDHLKIDLVLGVDLNILSFEMMETGFGDALVLTVEVDEKETTILTWSQVLIDQIQKVEEFLPMTGRIEKHANYYMFV